MLDVQCDVRGNVREWCLDSFANHPTNPVADTFETGGATRIQRGGDWMYPSNNCRSASLQFADPSSSTSGTGFRVVLGPILVP